MANVARQRRLADRIRHIVADMLELRIKDPRLGFVTITDVRVTPDLREASIFYTVYGDVQEQEASAQALASATGADVVLLDCATMWLSNHLLAENDLAEAETGLTPLASAVIEGADGVVSQLLAAAAIDLELADADGLT
ncbi:MAG: ribosome-binding factor A, partial [Candidatus Nanopelagicales bacterium]